MPINDNKLDSFSFNFKDQQNKLYQAYTATDVKAKFDSRGEELQTKLNALIDFLQSTSTGDSAAKAIGIEAVTGVTGANLLDVVKNLKAQIDGVALGSIPDASIAFAKFNTDLQTLINNKTNDVKAYGNASYSDSMAPSTTLTKTIALGGAYKNGIVTINSDVQGIVCFVGTDKLKTLVAGTVYNAGYAGGAWSRQSKGYITTYADSGNYVGAYVAGVGFLTIDDVYINGTNLTIVFRNRHTTNTWSLGCGVGWEVW
jgi:hypothetical protein